VAYLDPALVPEVLDVSQRQWEADVGHHRQTMISRLGLKQRKWRPVILLS
jgi:hypothetical protein